MVKLENKKTTSLEDITQDTTPYWVNYKDITSPAYKIFTNSFHFQKETLWRIRNRWSKKE